MTRRRFALSVDEKPAEGEVAKVVESLRAFNLAQTGRAPDPRKFGLYVKDGDGAIVGGLIAMTYWDWLYLDYFWLDERLRRRGWGRRLLERAERIALDRGCRASWLDTFSFQAPGFYRRMGYVEFGVLRDQPPGHTRHFFTKELRRQTSSLRKRSRKPSRK